MSKHTFPIVIFLTSQILLLGCGKEWFDIKSNKSLTVPSTLQDFQQLLDNYQVFNEKTAGLGEISSDDKYTSESMWAATFQNPSDPLFQVQSNAYTWTRNYSIETIEEWNRAYHRILNCNLIIEGINKLYPDRPTAESNQILGSALFLRANSLYDISQIFALPYDPSNDSEFGLQLKTSSDVTLTPSRSTVHETYNFIVNDLKVAAPKLSIKSTIPSRPSRLSAWALLSRIHLIMGDFNNSKKYADSVISNSPELLDYQQILNDDPDKMFPFMNKEVLFQTTMMGYTLTFANNISFVDSSLYRSYDDKDARKEIFFRILGNGGIRFRGQYNNTITSFLFSGIALDEIYLIRAESYAKLDQTQLAIKDITTLLLKRYKRKETGESYYIQPQFNTTEQLLSYIYDERKKELLYRGIRWVDLRRKSISAENKKEINRKIGGNTYKLEPDSYKFTFPIPNNEINYSGIKQNPGWSK